jgi:hypothetical protein
MSRKSLKPKVLFDGYQQISVEGDMAGTFVNPEGTVYTTTLTGCTCPGYLFTEHCKHRSWLWLQTPCLCGQVAEYAKDTDIYACALCGRTQAGEAVRTARARRIRKTA